MAKVVKSIEKSDIRLIDVTMSEFHQLIESTVQKCLEENLPKEKQDDSDELLNADQTAKFLGIAKSTLYGLTSKGEVPFMKRKKKLYFSKKELMGYLRGGKHKSIKELNAEADAYLSKTTKKGGYHE